MNGALVAVAGAVLSVLVAMLLDLAGIIAIDEAKAAIFRRGSFARRRGRYRGLSVTGYVLGALAGLAAFLGVAAATSGAGSEARDARPLFEVAAALALLAVTLLVAWWRLAGRPRHH